MAGCRVAAVFMQYGIVANYCWLLVEGVYLHSLLGLATFPERSFFTLYLSIGWGECAGVVGAGWPGPWDHSCSAPTRRCPHAIRHPLGSGQVSIREYPVSMS